MKAVTIRDYGEPDVLKFEDVPDPIPGAGEVLVKVVASCVNPFDYKIRSGAVKDRVPLQFPAVLGLDLSGTVHSVGKGVEGFAPGDHVFAHTNHTYAELCVVKTSELAKMPTGMSMETAAAIPTVTTTGAQLAKLALGDSPRGQTLLVTGAVGMVGRSAVHVAKKQGATVIAGVLKRQVDEAKSVRAQRVVFLDDPESLASLEGLDAVADTIDGPTANALLPKIKDRGVFASVVAVPSDAVRFPGVSIKLMQVIADPQSLVELANAVLEGELEIPIGPHFSLKDIDKAHAAAEGGAKGKVLIVI